MEAGEKFTKEAVEILRPEPEVREQENRFALRGKRLYLILGTIVALAILAVVGKCGHQSFVGVYCNVLPLVLYKISH